MKFNYVVTFALALLLTLPPPVASGNQGGEEAKIEEKLPKVGKTPAETSLVSDPSATTNTSPGGKAVSQNSVGSDEAYSDPGGLKVKDLEALGHIGKEKFVDLLVAIERKAPGFLRVVEEKIELPLRAEQLLFYCGWEGSNIILNVVRDTLGDGPLFILLSALFLRYVGREAVSEGPAGLLPFMVGALGTGLVNVGVDSSIALDAKASNPSGINVVELLQDLHANGKVKDQDQEHDIEKELRELKDSSLLKAGFNLYFLANKFAAQHMVKVLIEDFSAPEGGFEISPHFTGSILGAFLDLARNIRGEGDNILQMILGKKSSQKRKLIEDGRFYYVRGAYQPTANHLSEKFKNRRTNRCRIAGQKVVTALDEFFQPEIRVIVAAEEAYYQMR
jgi:hypothetical protein